MPCLSLKVFQDIVGVSLGVLLVEAACLKGYGLVVDPLNAELLGLGIGLQIPKAPITAATVAKELL